MDEEILTLPANNRLTDHNAKSKGYEWVLDIEEETPPDVMQSIIRMVREEGYQLGKPKNPLFEPGASQRRGLYKPLPPKTK